MDVKEIGTTLVNYCREGRNEDAIQQLYADDVVSVEAMDPPEGERTMNGKEAVLGKNRWWGENHEVHSGFVGGPFPHGDDRFAVHFKYDVTNRPSGARFEMEEVGVYTVADGRIVKEEFYYSM